MVAMKSMRRTAAERKADGEAGGMLGDGADRDGVNVRLEHGHIGKMGLDGPLPHGTAIEFHGTGEVADSGTHEGPDGEPRHHMTIRLSRAGMDHDPGELNKRKDDLKDEVRKNTDVSEAKAADRDAARGRERSGAKIPEKTDG